ncbi:MAG: MBL fold metallo-hydrolase [Paenibacillaceae bacterium]|uniref:MBL fold metallo-hydrolase n=1 Tax=Paenibacillus mellifer TaxID=2937794 RepID=A0A9X1Y3A0_9BACL|nr:MBL fold metallo-hydrolase [Paenibacillus mellifer]MBW4840883.1 MBL fold metallo-hydrolase [Paenibacillaceae bacterium]MCK8488831.1 MBL fold metallo-hydrolase [Paenibacillus mellifer]
MTLLPDIQLWERELLARVPISMAPPLRRVNSYVLRGEEGITIIDPGPRTDETIGEWQAAWKELGISSRDITQIVLTHHHPDHYGLAGYLQEITGAMVHMSPRAYEETRLMWGTDSRMHEALPELFRRHGMPESWCGQLPGHLHSFVAQVTPAPEVTFLREGEPIWMGGRAWLPIETAGHAPGHLSFYDAVQKMMVCGDAVLPQISPNISFLPGSDPQPLRSFLDSLVKLNGYEVATAYPGHRNPFDYFAERIRLLLEHHEERLLRIEGLLRERPQTAFDVCAALFGTELGIHQMRFAMSETLAHLVELVRQGRAEEQSPGDGGGEVIRFAPVK